jgi:hypothetical protein
MVLLGVGLVIMLCKREGFAVLCLVDRTGGRRR